MRFLSTLTCAVILAATAASAPAAIMTITDTVGDPVSVTVAPGDLFSVKTSITLAAGEESLGLTFFLGASQNDIFTLVSRTLEPANPFTDLTYANPALPAASPGLNPQNGVDLGGNTPDFLTRPAGAYDLYTLTLQVAASAPFGTYTIDARTLELSYANFDTFFGTSASYAVTVPEPVVLGMLVTASSGLLFRRRAKAK